LPVELVEELGQELFLELVADFEAVTARREGGPSRREQLAEPLERLVAGPIRKRAGPDPLDAQGRLAPPFRFAALRVPHAQGHAGAGDRGRYLQPELERHARPDREEIKANGSDGLNHISGCLSRAFRAALRLLWIRPSDLGIRTSDFLRISEFGPSDFRGQQAASTPAR
jgi:hypothetical protein